MADLSSDLSLLLFNIQAGKQCSAALFNGFGSFFDKFVYFAVEIFTNRIVMTNPGAPLIDTNRFIDLPPKSRNDKMAQAMFLFNLCEKRGSGMDRAVAGIEAMRLPANIKHLRFSIFPLSHTKKRI